MPIQSGRKQCLISIGDNSSMKSILGSGAEEGRKYTFDYSCHFWGLFPEETSKLINCGIPQNSWCTFVTPGSWGICIKE